MHDSVVALQEVITQNRAKIRQLAETLEQAHNHGVHLANERNLKTQLANLIKMTDQDELLIRDHDDALTRADSTAAAVYLCRIQYAAATAIEAANATFGCDQA